MTLSSVDPLVVHMADVDYIRTSDSPYEPFDIRDKQKFLVNTRTKFFELPSIKPHYNGDPRTSKKLFRDYVTSKGHNPDIIYSQVRHQIRTVFRANAGRILEGISQYPEKAKRSPHILLRIDFLVREDLKVYFIEANRSPWLNFEEEEYQVIKNTKAS